MPLFAEFRYAVFGWRQPTPVGPDCFSSHDNGMGRMILLTVAGLTVVETVVIHVLIWQSSPVLAWVLAALSLCCLVMILGMHQSLRLMPHMLTGDTLAVSAGTMGTALVPIEDIGSARRTSDPPPRETKGYHQFAFMADTFLVLELKRPVEARLGFGMKRSLTKLSMAVDEPDRLLAALKLRGVPVA